LAEDEGESAVKEVAGLLEGCGDEGIAGKMEERDAGSCPALSQCL
jgi:hypothetical protein